MILKYSSMWAMENRWKLRLLKTRIYLNLKETFIVPSFRRNLVSIYVLDKLGYTCSFGNSQFSLYLNSNIVGTGSLSRFDNLYFS